MKSKYLSPQKNLIEAVMLDIKVTAQANCHENIFK